LVVRPENVARREFDRIGRNPLSNEKVALVYLCADVSRHPRSGDHTRRHTPTKMYSVAATSTPAGVAARPTSAKKPRTATVVRATKDSKSEPEESEPEESEPEESGFWRKVFLPDGKEEVKAEDYQKFQAELKAQKAANAKKAAEKEGPCVIM